MFYIFNLLHWLTAFRGYTIVAVLTGPLRYANIREGLTNLSQLQLNNIPSSAKQQNYKNVGKKTTILIVSVEEQMECSNGDFRKQGIVTKA